jgi:hypothetical protein
MAREWKSRPAPEPTTIHEICRRYVATAATLAKLLGVPLTEAFIQQHRESIACCFIESGRAGVRLRASVTLSPLAEAPRPEAIAAAEPDRQGDHLPDPGAQGPNGHAIPTSIPADADLPCAGQEIAALKPAPLAMLIAKLARRVQDGEDGWVPLLHALQRERARRIEAGQRPRPTLVQGDGHGG